MSEKKYDVAGIGNAIVDVLSFAPDAFLEKHTLTKGAMILVDEARSQELYGQMGQATECSGGSVANSLAGMASLGGKCAFIGKVAADQLGGIFTHDLKSLGVQFSTPPLSSGPSTANCMIYVTPDAQRTMVTYLGACSKVTEADINEETIAAAGITYIEGYLWDTDHAKAAIRKAITVAKKSGRKIALTLSDTFCVDRHRDSFLELVNGDIDILFANESEIQSLYETDFAGALKKARGACPIIAVTRSEKGSVVLTKDAVEEVPTAHIAKVVDTTGAGDLYASGFLFGLSRGWELAACAALGNRCAGEIIQQIGARSMKPLDRLVDAA